MTLMQPPLTPDQRNALVGQIAQQLNMLDDQTLLRLAKAAREPAPQSQVAEAIEQTVSRRRFMVALLGSGVLATTASAVAAWQWGTTHDQALTGKIEQLSGTIEQLWGLVQLYKKLDQVPLDQSALTGLETTGGSLKLTIGAAKLAKDGIQIVQQALQRLEAGLPKIRQSLAWLEQKLSELSGSLRLLEDAIGRALDEFNPVTLALGAFFDSILKLLPLSVGQKAREVLDRIGGIIAGIPQMIDDISLTIVIPLREEWFSDEKDKGILAWLAQPVLNHLLDPLEDLLESIATLDTSWNQRLVPPLQEAISQRVTLRQQISEYKALYKLQEPN